MTTLTAERHLLSIKRALFSNDDEASSLIDSLVDKVLSIDRKRGDSIYTASYDCDDDKLLIDGIEISLSVLENASYRPRERDNQIWDLKNCSLCSVQEHEKDEVLSDISELEGLRDSFILVSNSTNEFISRIENAPAFDEVCRELLASQEKVIN